MLDTTHIFTATDLEYRLCQRYLADNVDNDNINPLIHLWKTKVGKTNVATSFLFAKDCFPDSLKRVINIGLCGSSVQGSKVYDLVKPVNFVDGDRDHECEFTKNDLYPEVTGLEGPTLVSSSRFVTNPTQEAYYDMEAFTLRALCLQNGSEFACYKIVSDLCNIDTYEQIDEDKLYEIFKEVLNGCRWIIQG